MRVNSSTVPSLCIEHVFSCDVCVDASRLQIFCNDMHLKLLGQPFWEGCKSGYAFGIQPGFLCYK